MDWTSIVTALIAALVPTGGLTAIVTLRDKKTAAMLENASAINEEWKEVANVYKTRAEELKETLDKKDGKIDSQHVEMSKLRTALDHARTSAAVANMLKCTRTECTERKPPFGTGAKVECAIKEKTEK